jgi:hypothetical protein
VGNLIPIPKLLLLFLTKSLVRVNYFLGFISNILGFDGELTLLCRLYTLIGELSFWIGRGIFGGLALFKAEGKPSAIFPSSLLTDG